jgi:hypothetical protein
MIQTLELVEIGLGTPNREGNVLLGVAWAHLEIHFFLRVLTLPLCGRNESQLKPVYIRSRDPVNIKKREGKSQPFPIGQRDLLSFPRIPLDEAIRIGAGNVTRHVDLVRFFSREFPTHGSQVFL